jgi:integrase
MSKSWIEQSSNSLGASSVWADALAAWIYNLRSQATRRAYRSAIMALLASADAGPDAVTQSDVIRWRARMERDGLAASSINARLAAASSFYRFARARGLRADNPVTGVGRYVVTPYGRAVYLDTRADEDKRLLAAFDRSTLTGARDYAASLLMLCTGLRVGSVLGAKVGALSVTDGGDAWLAVTLKGGGVGRAYVPDVARAALLAYLALRGPVDAGAPLFASTARGAGGGRALSLGRYGRSLASAARRAGLQKHVHPHALRHTAAMAAIRGGASVTAVSALLRHKSMRVTSVYIQHVDTGEADDAARALGVRYE